MTTGSPDPPQSFGPVHIHPEAEVEMEEAAAFYETREEGLGIDFLAAVVEAIQRAVDHPAAGTPVDAQRRRVYTRRFPYAVVYRVLSGGRLRVLAVADLRRRPWYWRGRR
jgi:toxin ParE1/3/4